MKTLPAVIKEAVASAEKMRVLGQPLLWPEQYATVSPDHAFRFLTECCWTYNEAGGTVELIPPHDYIRAICQEYVPCMQEGRTFILEKSRRLIASWVFRGLELWRSGLRKEKGIVAGLNYGKAAEHVWRLWWLYDQLCKNRPSLKLEPGEHRGGNVAAGVIDQFLLPNGGIVESLNQDGEAFQGSGYSWVTLEEFSLYKNPDYMYAQADLVTQGKPGETGGMVSIITNASPSKQWQGIKAF